MNAKSEGASEGQSSLRADGEPAPPPSASGELTEGTFRTQEAPLDAALAALWEQVLHEWQSETRHRSFLDAASETQQLPGAAGRYRSVLIEDELNKGEMARKQLALITALAFAQIDASRSPPSQSKRIITWVAFGVSSLLIAGCIYAISQ